MKVPGALYAKAVNADAPADQNGGFAWQFLHPRFREEGLAEWMESVFDSFAWTGAAHGNRCALLALDFSSGGVLIVRIRELPCDERKRPHDRYEFFLFEEATHGDLFLNGKFKCVAEKASATFDLEAVVDGQPLPCTNGWLAGRPLRLYCDPGMCRLAQEERVQDVLTSGKPLEGGMEHGKEKQGELGTMGRFFLVVFAIAAAGLGGLVFIERRELEQSRKDLRTLQKEVAGLREENEANKRSLERRAQWEIQRENFERNVNSLRTKVDQIQSELKEVNQILKDVGMRRVIAVVSSTNRLTSVAVKPTVKSLPPTRVEPSRPVAESRQKSFLQNLNLNPFADKVEEKESKKK